MTSRSILNTSLLAVAIASTAAAQGPIPIDLTYNWNGVVHAGEAGVPDDLAGFRSISDRALDFSAGVPSDALLDKYQLVSTPGALDIVHLGDRRALGVYAFDAAVDADNIGVQPSWNVSADLSGPQTSVITPTVVTSATKAAFIYQISNGGGSFDVTFTLALAGTYTASLSGPDWFTGAYPGTGNVDQADPDTNLSVTEGFIDLGQFAGDVVTEVTFSNRSNVNGGYAILAGNFENAAYHESSGVGCYTIDERVGWHQQFANSTVAKAALDNETLLLVPNGSSYTTIVTGTGTLRPSNPASPLTLTDDSQVAVTLPADFQYRGTTPISTVYVCSNGFLSMGGGNNANYTAVNTASLFTSLVDPAFVAYGEDLNPGNGGTVTTDYDSVAGVFYIMFEAVPHFSNSGAVTFQYQLELASGICTIVYGVITPEPNNSDVVLIGESAPGAITANPIDIFAATSTDTYATETIQAGVTLSADVPAVSSATTGTAVTYSVVDAPDFSPTGFPGAKVGVLIGSFGPLLPGGLDLGFLGAPGCSGYVTSLDFVDAFDLSGNYLIPFPAGIPPLTTLQFQAAMLFDTSDPAYATTPAGVNGNTFAQTSNALTTVISDY